MKYRPDPIISPFVIFYQESENNEGCFLILVSFGTIG